MALGSQEWLGLQTSTETRWQMVVSIKVYQDMMSQKALGCSFPSWPQQDRTGGRQTHLVCMSFLLLLGTKAQGGTSVNPSTWAGWVQGAEPPSMAVQQQCPPLRSQPFRLTFPTGKRHRDPAHGQI